MDYGFTHEGMTVTPNGTEVPAGENDERNKRIELGELTYWSTGPDRMIAYFKFPADDPHAFVPTPGFPYRCDHCGAERGLSPELCNRPRAYRTGFDPTLCKAVITTWPGTVIGRIVSARVYRHNFGGRMVSIRVKGTNGRTYAGRASWDNGNVIRLRRVTK
jgi:hypothetical protein